MADWSNPQLTSTYTNFVAEVKDRDVDLALQFDGTTSTNLATGTIRWSSSANRWQKWSGSTWAELTGTYALTGLSTTGAATIGTTLNVTGQTTLATATATTPSTADNNTNIATTAFVKAQGYAPLASPTFTGSVTIPAGASIAGYLTTAAAAAGYATVTGGGASGTWGISVTGSSASCTGNAATAYGLSVHAGRNNEANKVVRTDANGFLQTGYINSSNGDENNASNADRVWGTNGSDSYLRTYRTSSLSVGYATSAGTAANVSGTVAIGNGGTGQTSAAAALAALLPSQTGNSGKSLVTDGSTASWGAAAGITRATAVASTSGTAIDFTGIPAGVKQVTVMFNGVSLAGNDNLLVRLGTSGGFATTGYASTVQWGSSSSTSTTAGFIIIAAATANTVSGHMIISNISANSWVYSMLAKYATGAITYGGGDVALSAVLTSLRITTVGGTNTFDAGTINILYES